MMRPFRFEFACAPAPTSFLRLLLSLLMLAMFVVGGQALAQKAPAEATPMLAPPPPEEGEPPYNNASMVTQSVPSSMVAGQNYPVTVVMRNTGTTTWTPGTYKLAHADWGRLWMWGIASMTPAVSIAPGQQYTFSFIVTAPSAGNYTFQWQMLQDQVEWFGAVTNSPVTVSAPAALVNNAILIEQNIPSRMIAGKSYPVTVVTRNTGTTTWTPDTYKLVHADWGRLWMWGVASITPAVSITPGQQYTFSFTVTAPAAGDYTFQWQMLQDQVEWFGAITSSPVTVTENLGNVSFIHTDGLGSPVARTDGVGNVISRTRYEPYGFTASGAAPTIGFTGHVNDVDTGLTYMQQRYYDPVAGRFLSIDPVTTDSSTGGSFNRYAYANNNPYKYTDPDGRFSTADCAAMAGNCTTYGGSGGNSSSGTAKAAGTVFGGIAGGAMGVAASAACDFYSAGGCVVANGTIVGAGITGGAVIGAVAGQRLDNAWTQLSGLMAKATAAGPLEYQYALIAQRDGVYPDVRNGLAQLKAGDVWKYGTTNDPNSRYPQNSIGTLNLRMEIQSTGTRYQTLVAEKLKLIQYFISNGELPAGNRIFK